MIKASARYRNQIVTEENFEKYRACELSMCLAAPPSTQGLDQLAVVVIEGALGSFARSSICDSENSSLHCCSPISDGAAAPYCSSPCQLPRSRRAAFAHLSAIDV